MAGQQLSGVNAVLFFSVSIFEYAGTPLNSFLESIVVAAVQLAGTLASAFAVDRAGRRVLLMTSAAVMAVSLACLGAYFWILGHDKETAGKVSFLPLVSLAVFIFFFSIGYGPVPWIMMSELFMPEAKEKASAISGEKVQVCCKKDSANIITWSVLIKNELMTVGKKYFFCHCLSVKFGGKELIPPRGWVGSSSP